MKLLTAGGGFLLNFVSLKVESYIDVTYLEVHESKSQALTPTPLQI